MSKDLTPPRPDPFGLQSFADLLPQRVPIPGEDPVDYDGFHEGLMRALAPLTPYECLIAENLVAIEWELLQRRRMREAELRRKVRFAILNAVVAALRPDEGEDELDPNVDLDVVITAVIGGEETAEGDEADSDFDEAAAKQVGGDLADRAVSQDPRVCAEAHRELEALGLRPVEIMSRAYSDRFDNAAGTHDEKIQELERRRREIKRDYDALQKVRPIESVVEEAEVVEG